MTTSWSPSTPKPPENLIGAAMCDIPSILSEVVKDSAGQHTIELTVLLGQLVQKGHAKAAAEWAIQASIESQLLEYTTITTSELLPGPSRYTSTARATERSSVAVRATDALWNYWRSSTKEGGDQIATDSQVDKSNVLDLGIVIALQEEFRELSQLIEPTWIPVKDEDTGAQYYEFERQTATRNYKCVATFSGEMGESRATRVTDRMIAKYNPVTIAVLGIAGGIDKDIRLCDVVVADLVESYIDGSKAVSAGGRKSGFKFELAGKAYQTSHCLKDVLVHAEFANEEAFQEWITSCSKDAADSIEDLSDFVSNKWTRETPQVYCGPIGSGPTVSASEEFKAFLKSKNRNFLAVEMESGGVLGAIHEQRLPSQSLVIRGISDFGDERKQEVDKVAKGVFRKVAMRNAIRLLWCALESNALQTTQQNPSLGNSHRPSANEQDTSQLVVGDSPIPGCLSTTVNLRVDSVSAAITSLKDHFGFVWEPASFRETPPVIYWPVRLRPPTPIHAVQTFAAAALQKNGGHVILCLDDLGSREHTPEAFFATVRRWCQRVGGDVQFEERRFSEIIAGSDPLDPWPFVQKWLGLTGQKMLEVLRISKILQPEESDKMALSTLTDRRPRRLLTPAMVWTCHAQIQNEFADRAIITLGGLDERPLWKAWRDWIIDGETNVGHLYIPNLGVEPVHMASVDLSWDSRTDIEDALRQDVQLTGDSFDWMNPGRMIPWCLLGCVSLPDFVSSGSSRISKNEFDHTCDPEAVIPVLSRILEDRLLRHN